MAEPLYTTELLRLAASLPLETSLEAPSGRGSKRSPTCGSRIETEVLVDETGRIERIAQSVQACAFGQASAALVQRMAVGLALTEVQKARTDLASWLAGEGGVPEGFEPLAPAQAKSGRHGAMLLPFDALIAALKDSGR